MSLDEIQLNEKAIIKKVECQGNIKRRLLDLGFIKETEITPILISPSKDPRAFYIRGSTIALRKEDAKNVLVKSANEFQW
mgnify:FL=1